ncbi:MAG TPA: hypothetical protein VFJ85_08340 [Acidimicrobiales bacterium]|nr:hypothetical protein [Acidimicrobiales bacterium]
MNTSHLDDEALSASLDGEEPDAAAHLAACATCAGRRDALDTARRAVAAPPAPAPVEAADRAVAAALGAFDAARPPTASRPAREASVVPLAAPGRRAHAAPARRRAVPGWVLGVAAAVVAIALAVPVLTRSSDHTQASRSGAALRDEAKTASEPAIDGGDLGDQSDQLALGQVLTGALGGASPTAADRAAEAAPATTTAPPSAGAPSFAATAPKAATAAPGSVQACEPIVRQQYGKGLGALEYRASLRWQGTPAAVYAYALSDTPGKHRAFVMALDGCQLLVVQGF